MITGILSTLVQARFFRLRRALSWAPGPLVAVLLLMTSPAFAQATSDPEVLAQGQGRAIIDNLRHITTDAGIEELRAVHIGGIDQWISVRGRDRDNPILLFIHGGPAVPEMPASWFYQSAWEDYFTVVQWDQRGAGKSMASSNPETLGQQLTIDRFVSDAEELVVHLRATYGKRKIFVLGHSWGSVIGLKLAQRRPDWLHAYIGMGQAVDFEENERLGTEFALHSAEKHGNQEALAELQSILPYPEPGKPLVIEKILVQRKWLTHFGGLVWNRRDFSFQQDAAMLSPDYTAEDIQSSAYAGITAMAILPELATLSFLQDTRMNCPVFIFAGEHDYATSSELARQWLTRLQAPKKQFISFPGVAHELQFEAPGKLLFHLVSKVRPIAVGAGDGAPVQ